MDTDCRCGRPGYGAVQGRLRHGRARCAVGMRVCAADRRWRGPIRRGRRVQARCAARRWRVPRHRQGFPCCVHSPLAYVPSPIPRRNRSVPVSLASRSVSAFPDFRAGRLPHYPFRGLLGVHYALRPVRSLSRPRRPFVTGVLRPMLLPPSSAPTATGWSDRCRAGFAPAEE